MDLPGPGTEVIGGLTAPEGTVLIGRAFPKPDGTSRALLLVTSGDPFTALNDLLARAQRAGYHMRPGEALQDRTPTICYLYVVTPPRGVMAAFPIDRPLPSGHDLDSVICLARGERTASPATPAGRRGAGLEVSLYLPQKLFEGEPPVIDVDYTPHTQTPRQPLPAPIDLPRVVVPLRVGHAPARLAGEGERFGPPLTPDDEAYVVTRGSRLAGPVITSDLSIHFSECSEGGMVALLEVTGDVRTVHDEYVRQAERQGLGSRSDMSYRNGDIEIRQTSLTRHDGGMYVETAVEAGHATYLRIERCQD